MAKQSLSGARPNGYRHRQGAGCASSLFCAWLRKPHWLSCGSRACPYRSQMFATGPFADTIPRPPRTAASVVLIITRFLGHDGSPLKLNFCHRRLKSKAVTRTKD